MQAHPNANGDARWSVNRATIAEAKSDHLSLRMKCELAAGYEALANSD